jgi:hypothetical protein
MYKESAPGLVARKAESGSETLNTDTTSKLLKVSEPKCPSHKYEYIETDCVINSKGLRDGRYFTIRGKCIHCGKLFEWRNYDPGEIRGFTEKHDPISGKSFLTSFVYFSEGVHHE